MTRTKRDRLKFGPFEVEPRSREIWKNGVRIRLGGQPFEILAALLEKPGQLLTREELRKKIWSDDTFVDFNHGLNAAVNKLRDVLSDSAEQPKYIETLPRRGYRFIGRLEEEEVQPAPTARTKAGQDRPSWQGSLLTDEWEPEVAIRHGNLPKVWAVVAVIALLAILGFGILTEQNGHDPAWKVVRAGQSTIQSQEAESPNIWHLDVTRAAERDARTRVTSSEGAIAGPQPSPDGKKLVYMSGSHSEMDIWVSNLDGSGALKLTSAGRCGTPRWSPDSQWIAFDSDGRYGHSGIYIVAAGGGAVRAVVEDQWNNMAPSWSRDGQWIYFASNRDRFGEGEDVWKVSQNGGQLVRVTQEGGFSALESTDGRTLYYAKTRFDNPEIWKKPVKGGAESRVSSLLRPSTWANWAVTEKGILFLSEYRKEASTLEYFDFATRGVRPLGVLEKASFWLGASSDGSSIWYSELTPEQARLVFNEDHF